MDQQFANLIIQMLVGFSTLFVCLAKHQEIISFLWKVIVFLYRPISYVVFWLRLAPKIQQNSTDNKKDIENLKSGIAELSSFIKDIKDKLTPNGGSSIYDAIKRIEDRQLASDARHNALLNDSKLGVFYCSLDGHNLWVNRTYARFIGCGVDELLGLGWKKFIRTDELERYNKVWKTAFHDGCEFEETVEFLTVEHQKIRLHISVSAIKDTKGSTASYIGQILPL